jgi:transcriptional regulator with XRE-family HTH domain
MFIAADQNSVSRKVGANIREQRELCGLTQKDLGVEMGRVGLPLSNTEISKIESGTRRIGVNQLVAFAQALHVAPATLLREPGWSKFPWASEIDRQAVL